MPVHEDVDRLDMWIAIRGMINQKKPSCGYRELWIGEIREANRVGFFCFSECTMKSELR